MTAQPPDLLTFLAARFDDDEGMARILKSSQAMAQVEAHRRIVARHAHHFGVVPTEHVVVHQAEFREGCDTIRILASIYATHPAFDPSWRA